MAAEAIGRLSVRPRQTRAGRTKAATETGGSGNKSGYCMHAASRAADYLSDNFFHFFGSGKLALKIIEDRLQMEKCSNLVYDNN